MPVAKGSGAVAPSHLATIPCALGVGLNGDMLEPIVEQSGYHAMTAHLSCARVGAWRAGLALLDAARPGNGTLDGVDISGREN